MDWIPDSFFIDGKSPKAIYQTLSALLLGLKINTNEESWIFKIRESSDKFVKKLNSLDLTETKKLASTISGEFKSLLTLMKEKNIIIADLQILISPNGEITIIDPLDLLCIENNNQGGINFVDIIDPKKINTEDFIQSLNNSLIMLHNIVNWCDQVSNSNSLNALAFNLSKPFFGDQFNLQPATTETMPIENSNRWQVESISSAILPMVKKGESIYPHHKQSAYAPMTHTLVSPATLFNHNQLNYQSNNNPKGLLQRLEDEASQVETQHRPKTTLKI